MDLLESIAVLGAGSLALFIGACIVVSLWNEGFGDGTAVLLEPMLRRQGDAVAQRALASGDRAFALAIGQCTRCTQAAQCRAWLQSGAVAGFETFCPNAAYVQRMKALAG